MTVSGDRAYAGSSIARPVAAPRRQGIDRVAPEEGGEVSTSWSVERLPTLRDYQREAVEAIVRGQAAGGRGQFRAACGSGKSLVAVHAAARLCPAGLVVVACPSLPLLAQTLAVWAAAGMGAQVLAVCSDDTVADVAVRVADLQCPVTTRQDEVADWVRRTPGSRMRLILVTHLSVAVVGKGLHEADMVADLLVIDEAHHTAGWSGKHVALVHRDEHLPATRRLYMTATPRVLGTRRPLPVTLM
ncbi:hypothetical protein D0Q02_26675 [Micromonospora craniellae]|uniref:Helicase ATP-binding domain-containing protein n=1 Tax=Micromonospora craniellae TaxID=2294034 RepID=A0A372FSC2_9ACTN|nr:hypothetical protein D0Q02_26675 [Micromonospora craniellae]